MLARFSKTIARDLFVCQIYVDDIIFGFTNKSTCEEFSRIMVQKFEMSMMGELRYFLGFQIKQLQEGTFINHAWVWAFQNAPPLNRHEISVIPKATISCLSNKVFKERENA